MNINYQIKNNYLKKYIYINQQKIIKEKMKKMSLLQLYKKKFFY
jgi:hypothetical protein